MPVDPPPPRITRRMVLGVAGLATAVGAAGGLRLASWWRRDPGAGLRCLSPDEAVLIDAIAEATFPPGGVPALSGADAGISAYLDELFALMPEPTPSLLRTLLHALDDWSRLRHRSAFAGLPLAQRSVALSAWVKSDNHLVRGAIGGLMVFVSTAYCSHPDVREACGWVFPCGYER